MPQFWAEYYQPSAAFRGVIARRNERIYPFLPEVGVPSPLDKVFPKAGVVPTLGNGRRIGRVIMENPSGTGQINLWQQIIPYYSVARRVARRNLRKLIEEAIDQRVTRPNPNFSPDDYIEVWNLHSVCGTKPGPAWKDFRKVCGQNVGFPNFPPLPVGQDRFILLAWGCASRLTGALGNAAQTRKAGLRALVQQCLPQLNVARCIWNSPPNIVVGALPSLNDSVFHPRAWTNGQRVNLAAAISRLL